MKIRRILFCSILMVVLMFLTIFTAYAQDRYFAIGTGGTGGGYYPMGGAIADLMSRNIKGVKATAQVTAASMENAKLMQQDKCQLGLMDGGIAYGYADKKLQLVKYPGISSIMCAGYADVITVVLKGSPIKTMADLKGKRIGFGAPGSATEVGNKLLLTAWGLFDLKTMDIEVTPEYLSFTEAAGALKDRRIQAAMFKISGRPAPAITDISVTHDIRILSYEKEAIEKLEKAFPFMTRTIYPKGLYKGVDYDSLIIQTPDVLACKSDLSEDLVYQITKMINENLPDLQKTAYHGFKFWALDRSVGGVFPLHPGAKKYYDEMKIK